MVLSVHATRSATEAMLASNNSRGFSDSLTWDLMTHHLATHGQTPHRRFSSAVHSELIKFAPPSRHLPEHSDNFCQENVDVRPKVDLGPFRQDFLASDLRMKVLISNISTRFLQIQHGLF